MLSGSKISANPVYHYNILTLVIENIIPGTLLAQVLKGAWRHSEDLLECPGEKKRVAETELERHFLHRCVR